MDKAVYKFVGKKWIIREPVYVQKLRDGSSFPITRTSPKKKIFGEVHLGAHVRSVGADGLRGRQLGCFRFVACVTAREHPHDHVQDQNWCKKQSHRPIIDLAST